MEFVTRYLLNRGSFFILKKVVVMIEKNGFKVFCRLTVALFVLFFAFTGCDRDDPEADKGSGTREDPFLVETPGQLYEVRENPDKHFRQAADISLAEYSEGAGWDPIGDEQTRFTGSYDGDGHRITDFSVDRPDEDYIGLFGYVEDADIENVWLEIDEQVKGNNYVGGIAGKTSGSGSISGIWLVGPVEGSEYVGGVAGWNEFDVNTAQAVIAVLAENDYAGGLIGRNEGDITEAAARGGASGDSYVGGFIGWNSGNINESFAEDGAYGENDYIGGLTGWNEGDIENCYATGDYTGNSFVGGLAGKNKGDITFTYTSGGYYMMSLEGHDNLGGLVGLNEGTIINSYSEVGVSAEGARAGGLVGVNEGSIEESYASGNVEAPHSAGGLAGVNYENIINTYATGAVDGEKKLGGLTGVNINSISKSYATGEVSGDNEDIGRTDIGGLVGENTGEVEYSYFDMETTGQEDDEGKGIPKETSEMREKDTYENWDFNTVWHIDEIQGSYPYLQWQE